MARSSKVTIMNGWPLFSPLCLIPFLFSPQQPTPLLYSILQPPINLSSIFSPQSSYPYEQICTRALGHSHYMTCTVYVNKQNDFNLNDIIGLGLNAVTHGFVSCLSFHVTFRNIPLVWRPTSSCTEALWYFCSFNISSSEILQQIKSLVREGTFKYTKICSCLSVMFSDIMYYVNSKHMPDYTITKSKDLKIKHKNWK